MTHGSGSVVGSVPGASGIRFFTSLPREVSLADDGLTVHVKPPAELSGLRSGPPKVTSLPSFDCGKQALLGANVSTGEFVLKLNVSQMATDVNIDAGAKNEEVGMFLLGSSGMEEAVYAGYDGRNVFVDMRNSSQNASVFQSSFRVSNVAPFPKPASGVLQLHIFFDHTVIEMFASDCNKCAGGTLSICECRSSSKVCTGIACCEFPKQLPAVHPYVIHLARWRWP